MILKKIISQNHDNLISVFDLDSTLFDTTYRTKKIVFNFIEDSSIKELFPKDCYKIKSLEIDYTYWTLKKSFEASNLKLSSEFFKKLESFWKKEFFNLENLKCDLPYKGSVDFVKTLFEKGSEIIYLTARGEHSHNETARLLKKWGFPFQNENLYTKKKTFTGCDSIYKSEIIKQLNTENKKIFFFENDPKNLRKTEEDSPDVSLIFLDTTHSGECEPKENWFSIKPPYFFEAFLESQLKIN